MAKFAPEEWQTEQLRLTVFTMPGPSVRDPLWWNSLTGNQPDESTVKRKSGSGLIQGTWNSGKLILRLEPERIDWVYAPEDPVELILPSVGTLAESLAVFSEAMTQWFSRSDFPTVGRMAFGGVFFHPEENRQAGYARLPDYVPVQVDPRSSDFLYQINLPTIQSSAGIENLGLNRLSKWSVGARFSFGIMLTPGTSSFQHHDNLSAFRLEFDVNTLPTFAGPIPSDRLADLLQELIGHARKMAAEGVIPNGT
jgi:hypothetical protein